MKLSKEREEENEAFIKFMVERCEESEEPIIMQNMISDFIAIRKTTTNLGVFKTLATKYKKTIWKIKDEKKRAKQLFCLCVPIWFSLKSELRKTAHVKVDSERRIIEYVSHDGGLTLKGYSSHSASMKMVQAEKRKSQMVTMDSGEEEEEEEEEDDDAPEPPAPKKPRISMPGRDSGSSLAGSSASQLPTSSNSASQNRHALSPASPVTRPGQAPNPNGVNSSTPKAEEITPVAPGQVSIKTEDPEHQNILEPSDVKPDLYQPPREGILPPAAHKTFITNIQTLISIEKFPIDQKVVQKLGEAKKNIERVEMFGAPNRNAIQIDDLVTAIQHTVSVARRNSVDFHADESRSLQNFLLNLRFGIASLQMEELKELEEKLDKAIKDPSNLNKKIPIDRIKNVMHSIMDVLVPN